MFKHRLPRSILETVSIFHTSGQRNIAGKRYGKLSVVRRSGEKSWLCVCDCGKVLAAIHSSNLYSGNTRSCGCAKRARDARSLSGKCKRLYQVWYAMKLRCNDKKDYHYPWYGERGISVCSEWESYDRFVDWAMSSGYTDDMTIDRVDNDKGYSPDNCRWATRIQQANNTSRNVKLNHNGEDHTMAEWARIKNMPYSMLKKRIRRGWSADKALTEPSVRQEILKT